MNKSSFSTLILRTLLALAAASVALAGAPAPLPSQASGAALSQALAAASPHAQIQSTTASAPILWHGPSITFTKPNSADWTLPENQDRMTDSVWLTRANSSGLFNIAQETAYQNPGWPFSPSPVDTEWAFGSLSNYANLTYHPWVDFNGWFPPTMVGKDAVLHLISDDIYMAIRFTSWTSNGGGGGFSYVRSTPLLAVYADPTGLCAANAPCYTSIQTAIDAVLAGGTVTIYGGTYDESVTLNKNAAVTLFEDAALTGSLVLEQGSFSLAGNTLSIEGDLDNQGPFDAAGGTVVFNGAGVQTLANDTVFFNLTVSSGVTLTTSAEGSAAGVFINEGWTHETRPITAPGLQTFGLAGITIDVTEQGDLSSLEVIRRDQDHPDASPALQTGRWWDITPTGGSYNLKLSLPHANLTDPQVCKWPGGLGGSGWDCARDDPGFDSSLVWRSGIPSLSSWTVGSGAGPTTVQLSRLQALPVRAPSAPFILMFGLLGVGLHLRWKRKFQS